ncbi:hypothetical protein [Brachyspira pilosicoli]|uniref:hypothetical protein n=1 Tax=Brachyspira pilosicoli TaxID=52584 RepID=UPI001C27E568|nr:hypothetical protein [Brachyspira pilosicoli]
MYRKPVTIVMIPISIVKGARKPNIPSGFLPTNAIRRKLKAKIIRPITSIMIFFLESLS